MRGFFRLRLSILFGLFVLGLALPSCLPIPQIRLDLDLPDLATVHPNQTIRTEYVVIDGYEEINTPEIYNRAYYERYFVPADPPSTIIVLMPGIYGGAGSLDLLARRLMSTNRSLEVWVIDRRANVLEDREVMKQSIRSGNPYLAYDYYIKNFGKPEGFNPIPPSDLRFLAFWGLEVHLRDLHNVILQAKTKAPKVVLGGHSLGAAIVGFYAASDFGFDAPDLGFEHIDGLILIDGALGRTGGFDRKPEGLGIGPLEFVPGTEGLREGKGEPYLTYGLSPRMFARRDVLALLARFKPDDLAPEGLYPFPLTNLAAFGLHEDDQYGISTVFSSSWGEAIGAKTAGNLGAVLLAGSDAFRNQTVVGVAEGFDYVDWGLGDPSRERSDIAEVAREMTFSDTNRSEWYFPTRLALDIGEYDIRLEDSKGFIPNARVTTPTLAVGAGRGLVPDMNGFAAYQNARPGSAFSSYVLPGLTHFDIVQTSNNPLATLIHLWLGQLR
ncbi:MAG: hypothetical protein KC422_22020 [Trueperaceae bacterium]|nr:hypothetical protein [Trueperaceae bacterium]